MQGKKAIPWGRMSVRALRSLTVDATQRPEPWRYGDAVAALILAQRDAVFLGEPFPGYREWARQWRWTPGKARGLLRSVDEWSDPSLAEDARWQAIVSPERRGGGAREVVEEEAGNAEEDEVTPVVLEEGAGDGKSRTPNSHLTHPELTPNADTAHPGEDQPALFGGDSRTLSAPSAHPQRTLSAPRTTRACTNTDPNPNGDPHPDTSVGPPQVSDVWTHYRSRCPDRRTDKPPGYLAKPLQQAAKAHGIDAVCLLIDWLADGDGRAAFLRDGGHAWTVTPWRPSHLGEYLDMARAWDERGRFAQARPVDRRPESPAAALMRSAQEMVEQYGDRPILRLLPRVVEQATGTDGEPAVKGELDDIFF